MIFGKFLGKEIIISEQNFKNIRKSPKRSLTNNFVGSLIIYSKGRKQTWGMPNLFKRIITIFGCIFGRKHRQN